MVADLKKEDRNYSYNLKYSGKVVLKSKLYPTKLGAIRGFKSFSRSVKLNRMVICNDIGCYHVEVIDRNKRVIAESVNLENSSKLIRLSNRIRTKPIILKDTETDKMRTYIQNIGEVQLKEPLTVNIEKSEDYVASISKLNIFAYGDNLEEVIMELKEELTDLYNDLFDGKYKLARPAIEIKSYIEKLKK